jgi:SAM-dependent methyltransferase
VTPRLLRFLCDPVDKSDVRLDSAVRDPRGDIIEGRLLSAAGRMYPIVAGVPRFAEDTLARDAVRSFGDEWNLFNFDLFYRNWLDHTVKNTFGSADVFRGKVVVDAGAGSGMQSRWMSEAGAEYVISLELSHAVDGIMRKNLAGLTNVDVVQCSIDQPPIKSGSIRGLVICHNVIHHTRSVEDTARALWELVGEGGELVFNCYPRNDAGVLRRLRFALYAALRAFLSKRSQAFRLSYARVVSALRFVPLLGLVLEKSRLVVRGVVPAGPSWLKRAYVAGVLNTFDYYGAHAFQHHKTNEEIAALVRTLQPDAAKVLNAERYFSRPQPVGCALRLVR